MTTQPIEITPEAAREIAALAEGKGAGFGLRLFVEKGGCSGRQYGITIAEREPTDTVLIAEGAQVFVDESSLSYLKGSVLDYEDGLTSAGFRIKNPNARQTCGCGTSFEA